MAAPGRPRVVTGGRAPSARTPSAGTETDGATGFGGDAPSPLRWDEWGALRFVQSPGLLASSTGGGFPGVGS